MNIFFGTDGWRGLLDKEINPESISLVAQAFADYMKDGNLKKAAIAFDGRRDSDNFAILFAEVLSGNGLEVYLSNTIIPTPVLSFFVKKHGCDCGVMITASHNPGIYNGVKFKDNYGGPFFTEKTIMVEKYLGKSEVLNSNDNIRITDFIPGYFEQLSQILDLELIKSAQFKFVTDSMFGAGTNIIEQFLNLLGKNNCVTICGTPLKDFGGRVAEPIEKNLQPLSRYLKDNPEYAFGTATDGDADRLGILLDGGKWLSAQMTILLIADYLINVKKMKGKLVKTSSVTGKLNSTFPHLIIDDVQVGFKYICESMLQGDSLLGAEESGGYGYGFHIPERDGIFSALLFVEMLAYYGYEKLSELANIKTVELGEIFYDRIDHHYDNPERMKILPDLYLTQPIKIGNFEVSNIQSFNSSRGIVNGLKFELGDSDRWLLIRASETEPLIRLYAEGKCNTEVDTILNEGLKYFS